ncbi:metalloregulator ArsR/SmtB family transcription factor [Undibacterium sp. TC4M20W]|uniref:metalloregulator ArsR/SmtB family transcription factor n=1 Tax=Undibacterium sp. TC4M20W TaxID=3413052 RepID=UPI003BF494BB
MSHQQFLLIMEKVFEALASTPRRKILAYLSETELSAGEIAARFDMTKPSLSKHLRILESAGLIASDKRGQFVFYRLQGDNLANTLASFMQAVCPVSKSLKKESKALAVKKSVGKSVE